MPHFEPTTKVFAGLAVFFCAMLAGAQMPIGAAQAPGQSPAQSQAPESSITLTVVDENGVGVPSAQITVSAPGWPPLELQTDYAGRCTFQLQQYEPYSIRAGKPNFYQASQTGIDPADHSIRIVLAHLQIVKEQVNVTASTPGIDTEQTSGVFTMNTPEIINIPYRTSRDIRYLLPYSPGVVQDASEQAHVAGSETWETLDTLDGFDIRSPVEGTLDMRVSADAVRSIDAESTRYPVSYGRATGGVVAFSTAMGDNKFRFNATNFLPSYRDLNGIRFDNFVPRFTFSGPLKHNRAWWYDAVEMEWDSIYISELPPGADTDELVRGSNLVKVQANLTPANILTAGLLFNDFHSPYDGISPLTPQQSTTRRNVLAWLPYVRDQWSPKSGALLDLGLGILRFRDGYQPHGNAPYALTPELAQGSYFENRTQHSQRVQGTATLYLPAHRWAGLHAMQFGLDMDHIGDNENVTRAPVSYLREDGTLERQSVFTPAAPFCLHNDALGAYAQDRWQPAKGWMVEPGLRFDWDAVVRRALWSPRLAAAYAPGSGDTKLSAGIGLYYEHTYLEDLAQTYTGARSDTYYEADGATAAGPAQQTEFTVDEGLLHAPRALNWSLGVERKLPWRIYAGANFLEKRTSNVFTFTNQSAAGALAGDYLLTNARVDHYRSEEFDVRRLFANGYTVYAAFTHSSARTSAALDYLPTPSPLGPQQSGPLPWDVPHRVLSWGWLPLDLPLLKKHWDFVYLLDWHTGFPYTAVNAARQVVGAAGAYRYPHFVDFSPGLEWRFHFRGQYWGLRGVMENATDSRDPAEVNNVVDSPQFGAFSELQGRSFTARLRLIGAR